MTKRRITDSTESPVDFKQFDIKHDLTTTHFSQAVYCLGKSGQSEMPIENTPFILSSVLHFYLTMESAVNSLTDDIMFNEKSKLFIKKEDRNIELRKFFSNSSFEDKLVFLIERFSIKEISKDFIEEIKEFNKLRNLIVHNKIYRPIYSQPEINDNPRVWEVQYDPKVTQLFPKTKFNIPVELNITDSFKAFRICLRLLIIFASKFSNGFFYHLPTGDAKMFSFIDKAKTVEEHEKEIIANLTSGKVL